jgi:hypothetical protein
VTAADRALAKTAGAAQRIAEGIGHLARLAGDLPQPLAVQANAVVEEYDLLRFMLREATLHSVIDASPPTAADVVALQRVRTRAASALAAKRERSRSGAGGPVNTKSQRKGKT